MRLTHSSLSTFRTCNRRYQLQYGMGLRPARESDPLRIGGNIHVGLDVHGQGQPVDAAINAAVAGYAELPAWVRTEEDMEEWAVEREIVANLLSAYFWFYGEERIEVVATEREFDLPIYNPRTGRESKAYSFAGKIDKVVRLADGRLAVMEHKTTGESIDPEADYWKRLRLDQQISGYMWASRWLGFAVETVLYDVIRKPAIRPKLVKGTRETAEEFGARLRDDIAERPAFYFQRREVPRLVSDMNQFEMEMWGMTRIVQHSEKHELWPRNTSACIHPYKCPFLSVCDRDLTGTVPDGFVKVSDPHVELTLGGQHVHRNRTAGTKTTGAAEAETVAATP